MRTDYRFLITVYRNIRGLHVHRPGDNRASRSLSCTQAVYRRISSQVGDHWRIPAVVCFLFFRGSTIVVYEMWISFFAAISVP